MRQIILIILLINGIHSASAQFAQNNAIYLSSELAVGNYLGVHMDLNYVYKEKYSLKVGYSGFIRKPQSQPADYGSGLLGLLSWGSSNPYDQIENYQITVGKIYPLNESGSTRVNLSVGLGYTTLREPENWQKVNDSFLAENYTWNYSKSNTVSLIINPKIEFPFSQVFGLTISPMLQLNKDRTYVGVGVGHIIGLLRKRKV
jgi:hypothetical protein